MSTQRVDIMKWGVSLRVELAGAEMSDDRPRRKRASKTHHYTLDPPRRGFAKIRGIEHSNSHDLPTRSDSVTATRTPTTVGHFMRFGAASAVSTATSLLVSVLLARELSPESFAEVNVALIIGTLVAGVGSGLDSAGVRLMARAGAEASAEVARIEGMARYARLLLLGGATPIALVVVVVSGIGDSVGAIEISIVVVCHAAGLVAMNLALLRPLAFSDAWTYARRQIYYFGGLVLVGAVIASVGASVVYVAVPGLGGALGYFLLRGRDRLKRPDRDFLALSGSLIFSGAIFTLYDRLDVVVATSRLVSFAQADYAAASRLAGAHVLLTSVLVAVSIPRMSAVTGWGSMVRETRRLVPAVVAAVGLSGVVVAVSPAAIEVAFGTDFAGAGPVLQLMAVRYVLFAIATPFVIALPFIGRSRWQLELSILQAGGSFSAVLLANTPREFALAPAIGQVGGFVYLVLRLLQVRQSERRGDGDASAA